MPVGTSGHSHLPSWQWMLLHACWPLRPCSTACEPMLTWCLEHWSRTTYTSIFYVLCWCACVCVDVSVAAGAVSLHDWVLLVCAPSPFLHPRRWCKGLYVVPPRDLGGPGKAESAHKNFCTFHEVARNGQKTTSTGVGSSGGRHSLSALVPLWIPMYSKLCVTVRRTHSMQKPLSKMTPRSLCTILSLKLLMPRSIIYVYVLSVKCYWPQLQCCCPKCVCPALQISWPYKASS